MTPAPPVARRLSSIGCALVLVVAVALPGCGSRGATESTSAPPQKRARTRSAPGSACPARLVAFVDALGDLRRQLAVGLSYDQYTARVKALRADYEGVPIERLDLACLAASGTSGERAFNEYIEAANAWGDCLADASCDTATIEPVLQRKWRVASHLLGNAR
jgi:hypothetical protein